MEVFIDQVPFAATELDLIEAFAGIVHYPSIRELGAPLANYQIVVFFVGARGRRNKVAQVTFANLSVSQRLLSNHGFSQPGSLVRQQRLCLRPSNRGAPLPKLVNHLRTTPFLDPCEERKRRKEFAELDTPIPVTSVEFGRFELENGNECFSPELQRIFSRGSVAVDGERRRVALSLTLLAQASRPSPSPSTSTQSSRRA